MGDEARRRMRLASPMRAEGSGGVAHYSDRLLVSTDRGDITNKAARIRSGNTSSYGRSVRRTPPACQVPLRRCFTLLCLLLLVRCGGGEAPAPEAGLPNLVLIVADDLGYNDLGSYWTAEPNREHARIKTPNLDRIAREGMRFTGFYAAAPICTPSRAALMTGSYPQRIGMSKLEGQEVAGVITRESTIGLNPREITLAEILKPLGYATAMIGKWHLGKFNQFSPAEQGFDLDFGPVDYAEDLTSADLRRNCEVLPGRVERADFTRHLTEEAVRFIRGNASRPFFLTLAHFLPHVPYVVPAEFRGISARGAYGDAVMVLDWSTGRIVEVLEELGLTGRTLVLFTSDNGGLLGSGGGGSNYPLRGGKGSAFEGGFRVPCLAWWPGTIPPAETAALATQLDIYPTFAALAGAALPDDRTIDGRNIWPLMSGQENAASPRDAFFYFRLGRLQAVRSGDWKLHFGEDGTPHMLFNLHRDVGERTNLRDRHPDTVQRLQRIAEKMRGEIGDAATGIRGSNTRPAGFVIDGVLQDD